MAALIEPKFDVFLTGDWLDKTSSVRFSPAPQITGGTRNEGSSISPGRLTFTVNDDPLGTWNPRNPTGQYFGEIGKNTPIRVRVPLLTDNVSQSDSDGWGTLWVNGPSSGGTVADTNWSRSGTVNTHSVPAANAYRRSLLATTGPNGGVYQDHCVVGKVQVPTNNVAGGSMASRIEFHYADSNNFVGLAFVFRTDESVGIYCSEFIAGVERVLQADTTIAGLSVATAQTFKFAALIEGQVVRGKIWANGTAEPQDWQTTCTRASARYGYTGITTLVATGNSNTSPRVFTYDTVSVEARPFTGEASNYEPGVDDPSHNSHYVDITASGITQRTSQGNSALLSAERRWWTADRRWIRRRVAATATAAGTVNTVKITDAEAADVSVGDFFFLRSSRVEVTTLYHSLVESLLYQYLKEDQVFTVTAKSSSAGTTTLTFAPDAREATAVDDRIEPYRLATAADAPVVYWSLEEQSGAVSVSSGIGGDDLVVTTDARPEFGSSGDSFLGSSALMGLNDAELTARVPAYDDSAEAFTVHFLCHFPETDEASGTDFIQLFVSGGTAERYEIVFQTGGGDGDLRIIGTDQPSGTVLFDDAFDMGVRGKPQMAALAMYHTGPSTVQYALWTSRVLDNGVNLVSGPAVATATGVSRLGQLTAIRVNPGGGFKETGIAHLGVVPAKHLFPVFTGYSGGQLAEPLYVRFQRLTYEENIPFVYCAGPTPGYRVGPQQEADIMTNLADLADVDMGRFYESRGAYSFEYRHRSTLVRQIPFLELDYEASSIKGEMQPVDDDKDTRNDIIVTKKGGGAVRAQRVDGRLSVLPPGQGGVGVYSTSVDLLVSEEKRLFDLAGWLVHLGTVDEQRWPQMTVSALSGDISLAQMFSARIGNRYRVTNASDRGEYDPIDQLVAGYQISLDKFNPLLTLNGEPASPYSAAAMDDSFTATGQGTAISADYLIASDADAADVEVGMEVHLKNSSGALKQTTIFTVISKDSDSGFTNIHFAPNASVVTVAGDYLETVVSTRLDSSTSTLAGGVNTSATSLSVATTDAGFNETLWTTATAEFPFYIKIKGERIRVKSITGASSPQTFTVDRSVNGVVKSHLAGATVSLADPSYLAL